jgi:hypothetical protein
MAFHVPEQARITDGPMGSAPRVGQYGAFKVPSPEPGWYLALICDDGTDAAVVESLGWQHASVRAARQAQSRTPTWKEMAFVKDLCWDSNDVVMQLHPRKSEYINKHPDVLHLWRPTHLEIPTPPVLLV